MFAQTRSRIVFPAVLFASAFFAMGCVQPLGPGFLFSDRQAQIQASSAAPEQLRVRVVDHFDNVGSLPLRSLEVRVPEGANFGSQNLTMAVDGKQVSPAPSSILDSRMMRAALDPAWEQQQAREVVTEWDMTPGPSARGTVAASAAAFYIADETALPLWQAPYAVFAVGGPVPVDETLTVSAPAGFRILAPGKLEKSRNPAPNRQVSQTFHIRPDEDFLPYAVAGRYEEQTINARRGAVNFWTFHPLNPQQARTAAARLSATMSVFRDFFGPATNGKKITHIVESPGELPADFDGSNPGGTSFPYGALLDSRALTVGISNEATLELAEYELARTWFGWRVRPSAESQILMGRGVGLFGLVIAAEARGQSQRARSIASLLESYDAAHRIAPDRRVLEPPSEYSRDERITAGYKAALFLVALEDLCGHDSMRAAFREIVASRWNSDVSYEDMISAVEFASGRDLAKMFRTWLVPPGIPEDFRARYTKTSSARMAN